MPVLNCSVDGCISRRGNGLSFFRFPKDEARCQIWKNQLGFSGNHIYSNLTSEECYERIRICSLHFTANSFMITGGKQKRLHYHAIPSLLLSGATTTTDSDNVATPTANTSSQTDIILKQDMSCQTAYPMKNKGSQTDMILKQDRGCQTAQRISSPTPRKNELKRKIQGEIRTSQSKRRLETEITNDDVIKFLDEYQQDKYPAESCFLRTQLLLLNKALKGCRYSEEFKQFALSVYFLGPEAYKKFSKICRLPSKTTLHRFTQRWVLNPGFNDFLFRVTELRVGLLVGKAKDCILCIDEIRIKSHLFYDISKDKIIGFHEGLNNNSTDVADNALVVMARGIATNWKQPVAYFFYKTSPSSDEVKNILFEAVRKLDATGLNVLGVVSDQGSNFYKLVKTVLKLNEDNPCFYVDDKELVYMFDIPHLLKSTRNNSFVYKFIFGNKITSKNYLEQMYNCDQITQCRLAPKLSEDHLNPNNFQKMKVELASQIFSHSVAVAMFTYINFNVLPEEAKHTAEFIQKMNDFFDLLNSNTLEKAFMGTEKQISFLNEMDELFKQLRVESFDGKEVTRKLKFIYGWRLTIKAVLTLYKKLEAKGYRYLFTRNLNHDCLENFFGQVRNCCGNVKNPAPFQFARAFKKIFTLRYVDQSDGANCVDDINEVLLELTPEVLEQYSQVVFIPVITHAPIKVFTKDYGDLKAPEGNAVIYVTDYLLKKSLVQHSCDTCISYAYTNTSCKSIAEYVNMLENIFVDRFNELSGEENIGYKLKMEFLKVPFDHPCQKFPLDYFVSLFTRVRIYFTLKFGNREIRKHRTYKINTKVSILQHM